MKSKTSTMFKSLGFALALLQAARGTTQAADAASAGTDKPVRFLTVSMPKLKKAPTIDGKVDATEWKDAGMGPRLYVAEEDRLTDLDGKCYFGYTDEAIYIAFQVQRPENAIEPKATIIERDRIFWKVDDGMELWLSCMPDTATRHRQFYFAWNARGSHFDRHDMPGGDSYKFNPEWQSVSRTVPGYGWEGEVRLPFKELKDTPPPQAGDQWYYNLFENRSTPSPQVAMSVWSPGFPWVQDCSLLRITGDQGVFVRVLESGLGRVPGQAGATFEIVNPGAQAQKVAAKARLYRKKDNAPLKLSFLRSFEQSRDKGSSSDQGKVLVMMSDDKIVESILAENYESVTARDEQLALEPGKRQTIDLQGVKQIGDYLVLYEFRDATGKLIAGGPLPFVVPAPLEVKFANFFLTAKTSTAEIDLRYIPGWKKDGTVEARLYPADQPSLVKAQQRWPGAELEAKLPYKFSTADLKAGKYTLELTAKDAAGKVLAERKSTLEVPSMPKWFTEPTGFTPAVPEPWTPIKVTGNGDKLGFLMGDVELTPGSPWPGQIHVRSVYDEKRVPILRGPIVLKGKADGKEFVWSNAKRSVVSKKNDQVDLTTQASAGNLTVSSSVTFEYDGMEKVQLTFAPAAGQTVALEELILEVPMQKEFSALYLRGRPLQQTKDFLSAGKVPEAGLKHVWVDSVWLGNEERGFRWFAENMKGWRVGGKLAEEAIEVLNGPDGITLKLNFIKDEKPFVLDKPRSMTFGLMFTPTKTIRRDLAKLGSSVVKESEVKAGMRSFEPWYFKNQGWPEIYDDKERDEKLAMAKLAHSLGAKLTPYGGWFLPRATQTYAQFGGEMVVDPLVDGGASSDTCCWNTPIQDANTGLYADRIKDIDLDGFRLDAGFSASECSSLLHKGYGSECGWVDDNGNVQPSRHLFAARRAAQRVYRLFHGGGKEHGICLQHVHQGNRYDTILSHMDGVLSVEGAEMTMKSLVEFPLEFYRANVMGDQHGYQVYYLPKARAMGYDTFYGLGMIHNMNPRGNYPVAYNEVSYSRAANSSREVWRAHEWIGQFDPGVEFWGYWKNSKLLQTSSPRLIGSFHLRRGEKLLLAVMNLERKPVEGKITLDLKALGLGDKVYAYDPILKESVALDGGTLTLEFMPEGYRAIEIASKPFEVFVPEKIGGNLIPEADPPKWPAGAAPAGWTTSKYVDEKVPLKLDANDVSVKDGSVVLASDGQTILRFLKQFGEAGKSYVLEAEATIACDDGEFLGQLPDLSHFSVRLGDIYFGDRRTMTGQPLPGRMQKFRLYTQGPGAVDIGLRQAKGKAIIKKLELYEIKTLPPGFQVGKYGE